MLDFTKKIKSILIFERNGKGGDQNWKTKW